MHIKIFIICNLAILLVGGGNRKAIAIPDSDVNGVNPLIISQWSEYPETYPETKPSTTPQWSEYNETKPSTTPQWSDVDSPPVVPSPSTELQVFPVELQTHTVPSASEPRASREVLDEKHRYSPLANQQFQQPTAQHLRQGEVVLNLYNRVFFPAGSVEEEGTDIFPNLGFTWGVTNNLQLSFQYQHVDSSFPRRQGNFEAQTRVGDNEGTLEVKQRLWQNSSESQALSGVFSLSVPLRDRGSAFRREGFVFDEQRRDVVTALQFPFTASVDKRWHLTVSPTVAFFPKESALFLRRLPINDSGSFGTTFGFTGAVSYNISPRLTLWGDAFVPATGNNSINRDTGRPAKAVAFNAGFRYFVNPRIGIDVFATNTLGSRGPLALTADRDFTALGASIVLMPDLISANRRNPDSFQMQFDGKDTPMTTDGLAFFDGGTVPSGKFLLNVQGGSQGVLSSLRYGLLKDVEGGIYLDYMSGNVDASEQGFSGKIRVLNQAEGAPLTASLAATFGLPNQPFINFFENNRNEFKVRGLRKTVPFVLQGDEDSEGQLFIVTFSLPLTYQFDSGAALWATPIVGYVQRRGTELAGFNVGGSVPVFSNFSIVGEVGANFTEEGNAFIGNTRQNAVPWTFAIRWNPSAFLGFDPETIKNPVKLELYVTNRVGSSTWHQLRVRNQNRTAVGVGVSIPF
ncbi:MAG: hypothetical protein AB4426_20935 [Xenococcaceae cyanobacterium]